MKDIRHRVGSRIKELRNQIGKSQEQLGFDAELDRTYINSVEAGKRNISIIALEKITKALNCSLETFFNHEMFRDGK